MDRRQQIEQLHALYVELTGQQVFLSLARESEWFEWLRYRRHAPFTEADLRAVIDHRRRRIRKGEVTEASLKFHNLIGQPDFFEEDLGIELARRRTPAMNPAKAEALRATGRDPGAPICNRLKPEEPAPAKSAKEILEAGEAFKKLVEFRKSLEK